MIGISWLGPVGLKNNFSVTPLSTSANIMSPDMDTCVRPSVLQRSLVEDMARGGGGGVKISALVAGKYPNTEQLAAQPETIDASYTRCSLGNAIYPLFLGLTAFLNLEGCSEDKTKSVAFCIFLGVIIIPLVLSGTAASVAQFLEIRAERKKKAQRIITPAEVKKDRHICR